MLTLCVLIYEIVRRKQTTQLFQELQLQPGPFKLSKSEAGDSLFHPEVM